MQLPICTASLELSRTAASLGNTLVPFTYTPAWLSAERVKEGAEEGVDAESQQSSAWRGAIDGSRERWSTGRLAS